ncbi:hypothetical protein AB0M22_37675 [Nocardia sp. NPDC051756]|uniref:hypothetical protein n=1 Tax=Nocardia sp. NPDC051756 TaxID=3154751 RepID=UPI0034292FE9
MSEAHPVIGIFESLYGGLEGVEHVAGELDLAVLDGPELSNQPGANFGWCFSSLSACSQLTYDALPVAHCDQPPDCAGDGSEIRGQCIAILASMTGDVPFHSDGHQTDS